MVHLLELAVTFIEKLETHLETIRNIPHLEENLKQMVSITNIAALSSYTRISTVWPSHLIFLVFILFFSIVSCSSGWPQTPKLTNKAMFFIMTFSHGCAFLFVPLYSHLLSSLISFLQFFLALLLPLDSVSFCLHVTCILLRFLSCLSSLFPLHSWHTVQI